MSRHLTTLLLVVLVFLVTAQTWRVSQLSLRCERLEYQVLSVQSQVAQAGLQGKSPEGKTPPPGAGPERHKNRTDRSQLRTADFMARAILLETNGAPALSRDQVSALKRALTECETLYQQRTRAQETLDGRSAELDQVLTAAQLKFIEAHQSEVAERGEEIRQLLTKGREEDSVFAQALDYFKSVRPQ